MLQQNVAIKEYFPVRYAKRLSSHLSNVGNENSLTEEMVSFQLSATSMVYPQPGQEENYLKGMQNFLGEARLLFGQFDIEGIDFIKDFFDRFWSCKIKRISERTEKRNSERNIL